jgi:hypothetical protein
MPENILALRYGRSLLLEIRDLLDGKGRGSGSRGIDQIISRYSSTV